MNEEGWVSETSRRRGYIFQAVMVLIWWLGILLLPDFYRYFAFDGLPQHAFLHFALPDLVVITVGSFLACTRAGKIAGAVVLGGFLYAAFYCLSASIMYRSGFLGTVIMLLGAVFNIHLLFGEQLVSRRWDQPVGVILFKSYLQSLIAWFLTLLLIPGLILLSVGKWPATLTLGPVQWLAILLFTLFGSLGLYCSYIMSTCGLGTPVPLDAPTRLVVQGPYAHVRNPMAIAGLGQGFAVALFLLSWEIALYVLLGLIVWNGFVRPVEEKDLEAFFGDEFRHYRQHVKCWFPARHGYAPGPRAEPSSPAQHLRRDR